MRNAIRIVLLALLIPAGARAAAPASGSLHCTDASQCATAVVDWSGHFDPILAPGLVEQCQLPSPLGPLTACDHFALEMSLPSGYWSSHPGAVEVAIRWPSESTDRDVDLFVYKDGAPVGSSTGQDSSAEVAFLPSAGNGVYDVYVVPVSLSVAIDYEGRVEVESKPAAEPLRDLLPNMTTIEPHTLRIATGEYLIDPVTNEVISCYPEETLDSEENLPTRCLRFDQIAANVGEGPLELRYRLVETENPLAFLAPDLRQIIYRSDGSTRHVTAETMEFHAVHGHWHYKGFGLGKLYDTSGVLVRQSNKKGFCLIDVDFESWGAKGNNARKHSYPGCQLPNYHDEEGDWVEQGIEAGWADVYNWFLADQFIDITGLPDGVYRLEVIADPNNTLLESDETDNARSTWICIAGMDVAKVSGSTAECPMGGY